MIIKRWRMASDTESASRRGASFLKSMCCTAYCRSLRKCSGLILIHDVLNEQAENGTRHGDDLRARMWRFAWVGGSSRGDVKAAAETAPWMVMSNEARYLLDSSFQLFCHRKFYNNFSASNRGKLLDRHGHNTPDWVINSNNHAWNPTGCCTGLPRKSQKKRHMLLIHELILSQNQAGSDVLCNIAFKLSEKRNDAGRSSSIWKQRSRPSYCLLMSVMFTFMKRWPKLSTEINISRFMRFEKLFSIHTRTLMKHRAHCSKNQGSFYTWKFWMHPENT